MTPTIDESMQAARKRWAESGLDRVLGLVLGRVPRRTGKLATAVERQAKLRDAEDGFIIKSATHVGHIWEATGRKATTIPRRRPVLMKFEAGGEIVFARKARIPAMAARPFIRPSLDESEGFLTESAERETTAAILEAQPDRVIQISA